MLGYTNIEAVMLEAGLSNNEKVDPRSIEMQIAGAEGIVNGTIGNMYAMPLPFRLQNSVEFEGVATGSGNIVITINSVAYTVAVTSGLKAEEVADLFREEIRNVSTITPDPTYDRAGVAKVRFISTSMVYATANTQVDITTIVDGAAGMTSTEGEFKIKRYPFLIELITRKIAAAYVLEMSFGKSANGSDNDADTKLDRADALLDKIIDKEIKVVDDVAGNEIPRSDAVLPKFNPSAANTAKDTSEATSTPNFFKYNQQF